MAAKKSGKVTIEQIASANRRPQIQGQTLIGLGLNKIGRQRTLWLLDRAAAAQLPSSLPRLASP